MPMLNVDFRLLDARAELPALRDAVRTLEDQLEHLADKRRQQVLADLQALGPHPDDAEVQLAFQELQYEVEFTYPRVYRGALFLVIWAAYESTIQQVADFLQKAKGIDLGLTDIRGRGLLERAKKYYPNLLGFDLFTSKDAAGRVGQVAIVRNAFAHVGGRIAGIASKRPRRAISAMVEAGSLDEFLGYVVPTKAFLGSALTTIETEASSLVARALAWDDARKKSKVAGGMGGASA